MEIVKKTILGHVPCPLCPEQAHVRHDKNENPYIFCPMCTAQVLTHGGAKGRFLLAKMTPAPTVTDTVPLPPDVPAPAVPKAVPAPPVPTPADPPEAEPAPTPKKSAWLQPIMGSRK